MVTEFKGPFEEGEGDVLSFGGYPGEDIAESIVLGANSRSIDRQLLSH